MNAGTQKQLAEWVQRLINDPSTVAPMTDWMDEQGINSQQLREVMKPLLEAKYVFRYINPKKKFCSCANYFTKYKEITISQLGYSLRINSRARRNYQTNEYLNRCATKLT